MFKSLIEFLKATPPRQYTHDHILPWLKQGASGGSKLTSRLILQILWKQKTFHGFADYFRRLEGIQFEQDILDFANINKIACLTSAYSLSFIPQTGLGGDY